MKKDVLNRFDLTGGIAAITGGGGDLCGAMAEALGAMGVKVAVLDINAEKAEARALEIIRSGGTAKAFQCDVLHRRQVQECYAAIGRLWGPPDFLINGAGGNDPRGSTSEEFHPSVGLPGQPGQSFFDLDPAGFRQVFDLNFLGTFLVTQTFSQGMVEKGKGSIINLSSMSAFMPLTKVAAYSAAKAAVSNFTRWLAVHLSRTGVRVNGLAPGFFMTEQLKFLHLDEKTGEPLPRARKVIAHTPLGRYGLPEDLIGTVVWLLSDASGFVTGVVVPVDGGFSSYSI
ncbi:MAG TPA: SDR family oxidoreductase [Thermodesulfobacteriota bacterium]|nr:SDR family oxidoreductase [Thermodesulfobacteriota bacterium]